VDRNTVVACSTKSNLVNKDGHIVHCASTRSESICCIRVTRCAHKSVVGQQGSEEKSTAPAHTKATTASSEHQDTTPTQHGYSSTCRIVVAALSK
jgi:hypothetical protein